MPVHTRNSEESDIDKGPYLHVSSSGFVAAEDLQFSNSEITGMPQYDLVAQYLTLFALARGVNVDVDRFHPKSELKANIEAYWFKCGCIWKIRRRKLQRGGCRI